jgi:hypothetical protein
VISQIDFYANGKLQYFFTTTDQIHIIDRLGDYVENYPLTVPNASITHASIIDYDHSKKYRFLIADKTGKLMMFDKEGTNLDGWNPKNIDGMLGMTPQHHRIKGKDYLIAIRNDGTVYLMNRRGETLKNFPIDLETKLSGNYFLEIGNSLHDTFFVVVSNDGYRIKFTVEGKIQSKETLLKTSVNTRFGLVSDQRNRSYLIIQRDNRLFNLLDENNKKIISNEFVGLHDAIANYFDFGSGRVYVTITDLSEKLTYIYDGSGNLLTPVPIESSLISITPIDSDQARLFMIQDQRLTIQPL